MIDWLLTHRRTIVRFSRWVLVALALGLLGIAQLPPGPVDRIVALTGIAVLAVLFCAWLALALTMVLRPRLLETIRARRRPTRGR